MKRFSESDIQLLKGKQQTAVERLFIELRDAQHVAIELFVQVGGLWWLVHCARKTLAAHGILLPDRRFAGSVNPDRGDVF